MRDYRNNREDDWKMIHIKYESLQGGNNRNTMMSAYTTGFEKISGRERQIQTRGVNLTQNYLP